MKEIMITFLLKAQLIPVIFIFIHIRKSLTVVIKKCHLEDEKKSTQNKNCYSDHWSPGLITHVIYQS